MSKPKVYIDLRDWWIGYYRGDTHHYVCVLPTVVIRWRRKHPALYIALHTADPSTEAPRYPRQKVSWSSASGSSRIVDMTFGDTRLPTDERDPECVERWPECASGEYDQRCCRFPKSCSAGSRWMIEPGSLSLPDRDD